MQLESLEVFCDVVRLRSFSKAAVGREITQSAVSQVVSTLEKRMDVQLIDRSTRPLKLTSIGQTFYEGCKTILEQYAGLESRIRSDRARMAGTVRVAAIYSVGLSDLEQYVSRFHEIEPGAQVKLEYLHPNEVYQKVLDGTADLGLISFPRKNSKIDASSWCEEPMVVACAPQHELAKAKAISPADLYGRPYIHFDKDLAIRRHIDRFWRDNGAEIKIVLEFDNIENIKQAVSVGAGVALLPEPTLRREVDAGILCALSLIGVSFARPLGVIQRKRQRTSHTATRFLQLLLDGDGIGPANGISNAPPSVKSQRNSQPKTSTHRNGTNRLKK